MSLAENLLNSLGEPAYQNSRIAGSASEEEHIIIGADRRIVIPDELKIIAVTGDKNIETVTFDCVRYWDDHDLSAFKIFINYILPSGEEKTYSPQSVRTNPDDDTIFNFDWRITPDMTQMSGHIIFAIVAEERDSNGELLYRWGSLRSPDAQVAEGIGVSDNNTSIIISLQDKTITQNGVYTADEGFDGLGKVTVNVSGSNSEIVLQTGKRVTPTKEIQVVQSDEGYGGLLDVTVEAIPSEYIIPSGTEEITQNGTYDVTSRREAKVNVPQPSGTTNITTNGTHNVAQYESATVSVTPNLQEKTITVSANTTVVPDSTYDGLSKVKVNVSNKELNVQGEVKRTVTENDKTYTITPDAEYDAMGSVSVTVDIPDGSYFAKHTFESGDGSVSVTGTSIGLEEVNARPTSGYYITAVGKGEVSAFGTAEIEAGGYIPEGSKTSEKTSASSKTATKYYTISTESKVATPSTTEQTIYPKDQKLLSSVVVKAIPNQRSEDQVVANGATVSFPAGYYPNAVEKTVEKATRAKTTLVSEVTNNALVFRASNNQATGYVVGSEESATKTVTLSVKDNTVEATDGTNSIRASVSPDYIIPSGTKTISSNGTHDVTECAFAKVDVPIPDGYIKPSGIMDITANGLYNVSDRANVNVNVPIPSGYVKPEGNLALDSNGTYDVTLKKTVTVSVPSTDSAMPLSVASEVEMEVILQKANQMMIGGVYRYTGADGKYKKNKLYILGGV